MIPLSTPTYQMKCLRKILQLYMALFLNQWEKPPINLSFNLPSPPAAQTLMKRRLRRKRKW